MVDFPLPTAFYFSVRFDAEALEDEYAFQEVGGFGPEMQTEPYKAGGENHFEYALPKGVKHPKLSLKRGVARIDSTLVGWCRDVLEGGLTQPIVTRTVHVSLLNDEGASLRGWVFADAYPVHWDFESFNATKNAVAVERIELSYTSVKRTTTEYDSFAARRTTLAVNLAQGQRR